MILSLISAVIAINVVISAPTVAFTDTAMQITDIVYSKNGQKQAHDRVAITVADGSKVMDIQHKSGDMDGFHSMYGKFIRASAEHQAGIWSRGVTSGTKMGDDYVPDVTPLKAAELTAYLRGGDIMTYKIGGDKYEIHQKGTGVKHGAVARLSYHNDYYDEYEQYDDDDFYKELRLIQKKAYAQGFKDAQRYRKRKKHYKSI
eukprot:30970_1